MVVDVNPKAVWIAGAALALLSVIGAYQGWERSSPDAELGVAADPLGPTVNALSAKPASALVEPTGPTLTEAQIRSIARQEARAALSAGSSDDEPAPAPARALAPAQPPVTRTTPTPLQTAPQPPPAPTPAESNAPPLF